MNTIPSIVESVHMEMQIDFQTPCIHWGHNYFLRVLLKNESRFSHSHLRELLEFFSNMKDVASYSSMWYVTKRYKLFCPNTHRWDTAIYIESIDLKIKI